jgi:hypothetical protein
VALLVVAALLFLLLVSLRGIAGFYTDYLWFDELGLTSVWSEVLAAKVALGAIFTVAFFVLLWVNLAIADRIAPRFRPAGPEEDLVERYRAVVGRRAGLVRTGVALLFALITGAGVSSQWDSWILFTNGVKFGVEDPQFGRDVGFYVFDLPFLTFVVDWAFAAVVIVLVVTAVAHYLNGGIRFQVAGQRVTPQVKAHLSVLLGVLALLKAAGYYFQQFELSFSTRGVVDGATYTDVQAQLPAIRLLIFISVAAAILFLVNIRLRGWVLPVLAVGLWAFLSVAVGAVYPAFVQRFRVQPAESTKEAPYIERNIAATRAAMGLGDVKQRTFEYDEDLTAADLADNTPTIRNVRLWDPDVLETTYQRLQEIRPFYSFEDVDIDRYELDGQITQVVLSARELNPEGLPSDSWVNRHVQFTHGYGAVLSPANAVTKEGQPAFVVSNIPLEGEMKIEQPGLYFGENVGGYAIVRTKQQEIDFQDREGNTQRTTYKGRGGVRMGSLFRRAAFALRFGNINPLISGFITSDTEAVYVRDIRDRVRLAAPFLQYDSDPYPVILDGRILWVQDAYTTTTRYPYAQRADTDRVPAGSGLGGSFNYVRNSVKVVIDAYHGDMTFFVVDPADPIVQAYAKAFPKLFTDGDQVQKRYPGLVEHFRFPEDLFRVQTNMFARYHIADAAEFYSGEDRWNIAQDPGSGRVGSPAAATRTTDAQGNLRGQRVARMDPAYLLMRLPGEDREHFVLLQPFVPFSADDRLQILSSFMVARRDPGTDGARIEVFEMPRGRQIDGPKQVDSRMNQEPEIAREISLLNQQGSEVIQGQLLIIPVKESLLYIRPLYVQAANTPLPEFKKAIVAYGERVVMRDTLAEALAVIFGAAPETLEERPGDDEEPAPEEERPSAEQVRDLLGQASAAFAAAQEALTRGDLAGYQRQVERAADLVRRAQEASGAPPPTTTTATTVRPSSA